MLLLEQCRQLTVTEDSELLSKVVFESPVGSSKLWWCLSYLHEKLLAKGEKRILYRWVCFFQESVNQTGLLEGQDWLHKKTNTLPEAALQQHAATSEAVVSFVFWCIKNGRTPSLIEHFRLWLPSLCNRACAQIRAHRSKAIANAGLAGLSRWSCAWSVRYT